MRRAIGLMGEWNFIKDGKSQTVQLPHTWNGQDGQDGGNDYYRGCCSYEREFGKPEHTADEVVYLVFHGVNASAQVILNEKQIANHHGGYSTFRVNITKELKDLNRLKVLVDNSVNNRVYPQKADFTFYGGIYREVELLILSKDHFDLDYYGSDGVKVTPKVQEGRAWVHVESFPRTKEGVVELAVLDRDGETVIEGVGTDVTLPIDQPKLWQGRQDPYLYTLVARLKVGGKVCDEVRKHFGLRSFTVDPKKGFFLNGVSYPLRGVSRHQDRRDIGNAISREQQRQDMELICEVGANTIRLAHYQHDQYFYDLCDEKGMIVWAEIPYISEHMPAGRENTFSQMKELIVQNHHHPSIAVWGVSNEITISTRDTKDMLDNHRALQELCHEMDPDRYTTLACYACCLPFQRVAHITDLVGWNLYLGWYVPGFFLNDLFLRFFHLIYPNRPIGYSEYGAEGMPNLHSAKPRRGDHTEEYQALYHEKLLRCFERYHFLWSTYVWNMFDFAADARDQGGESGMNHKGLITFDRSIKKDSFYLYKAWWSTDPFVHLCGARRRERSEEMTTVKVYTNQPVVTLYLNGELLEQQMGERIFTFRVPLAKDRENQIRVEAGVCRDEMTLQQVPEENPQYRLHKGSDKSSNWT